MEETVDPFAFSPQREASRTVQASIPPADVAKLIKQTIETQMVSWQGMVSSLVKEAVCQALDPIQKGLAENGEMLKSLKGQLNDHAKRFDAVSTRIDGMEANVRTNKTNNEACLAEMIKMQKKLNELEDRSRLNNVRLVGLPLGVEANDPRGYLQKMLPKWIPTLKSLRNAVVTVDKAHRIFSNKASGSRTMIFRLLHFPDRQAILEGARTHKPVLPDGSKLLFFADYSPGTTKERRAFSEIRSKLWQKEIESFLIYPAILKVNYRGKKMTFNSVEEAKQALRFLDAPGHAENARGAQEDRGEDDEGRDGEGQGDDDNVNA